MRLTTEQGEEDRKTNVFVTKRNDNGLKSHSLLSGMSSVPTAPSLVVGIRRGEPENARCGCPDRRSGFVVV